MHPHDHQHPRYDARRQKHQAAMHSGRDASIGTRPAITYWQDISPSGGAMTGPEHYAEAERLLAVADRHTSGVTYGPEWGP